VILIIFRISFSFEFTVLNCLLQATEFSGTGTVVGFTRFEDESEDRFE